MRGQDEQPVEAAMTLADRLKQRTWSLHREAEQTGVISDLLRGRIDRTAYAALLRNLLPVYQALEDALERLRRFPVVGLFARPEIYRAAALRDDLDYLAGPGWDAALPVLPAAISYAARVTESAGMAGGLPLIGHAYTRTLGDLNGGQILKRVVGKHLGLDDRGVAFHMFPAISDLRVYAQDYRSTIDRAGDLVQAFEPILAEAELAFRLNIDLSNALQSAYPKPAA